MLKLIFDRNDNRSTNKLKLDHYWKFLCYIKDVRSLFYYFFNEHFLTDLFDLIVGVIYNF